MKIIDQCVLELCNNDPEQVKLIRQKTRKPEVTRIRFRVIYELKEIGFTLQAISDYFNYKDHSSVINSIKRAKEEIEFEERIKKHIKL